MRLPNGYGEVVKLSGARRRPYAARITTGWYYNDQTEKRVQRYQILGYAATRAEALQILAHYNDYPIDGASLKLMLTVTVVFPTLYGVIVSTFLSRSASTPTREFDELQDKTTVSQSSVYRLCHDLL